MGKTKYVRIRCQQAETPALDVGKDKPRKRGGGEKPPPREQRERVGGVSPPLSYRRALGCLSDSQVPSCWLLATACWMKNIPSTPSLTFG